MTKALTDNSKTATVIKSKSKYKTRDYLAYFFINRQNMFLMFILIVVDGLLILGSIQNKNWTMAIIYGSILLLVIGIGIYSFLKTRNLYLKKRNNPDIIFEFLKDKIDIIITSDVYNKTIQVDYSKIIKAIETPKNIYLILDRFNFFVVDKFDMLEGSSNDMITFLQSKIQYYLRRG